MYEGDCKTKDDISKHSSNVFFPLISCPIFELQTPSDKSILFCMATCTVQIEMFHPWQIAISRMEENMNMYIDISVFKHIWGYKIKNMTRWFNVSTMHSGWMLDETFCQV